MSKHQQVFVCAALLLIIALWATLFAEQQPQLLTLYDFNQTVAFSEPWRLITAHLLHLNRSHLWLNLAALVMLTLLFVRHYEVRSWLNGVLIIMVGCSLFTWLIGQPQQFVGLSGVLHGLLMQGVLLEWSQRQFRRDPFMIIVVVILFSKVCAEFFSGPLTGDLLSHGDSVWVMHAGGLISGVLAYLLHRKPIKDALPDLQTD
jgi:rhomboid family GlyGly-CTERM serine protease